MLELEVNPEFEHGLLVDAGHVDLEGVIVEPTELAYTGTGEKVLRIRNHGHNPARMLFIGGEPFQEEIVMWWNFIGRDHAEIERFRQQWQDQHERFGAARGYIGKDPAGPTWLPAPTLPNAAIRPRKNPEPVARPEERI